MTSHVDASDAFAALMRQDLSSFIQRSFATVDPGTPYLHSWHIDAIAYQLELLASGKVNRLIVTMPPRSLKSIAISVAFPAWLLGRDPRLRIMAVSYSEGLAEKLASDCLKVIEAPWYREAFPATRIARGRGARLDFETTRGGGRFSSSVGGSVTGRGGDIILLDDPHKPEEAGSDVRRQAVLDWYRSTLLSRLNRPLFDPIVLVQQRIHEADLAGHLLEQVGWHHLNLPATAEEDCEIPLGRRGTRSWRAGELLHPGRLPADLLERRRAELGSYVFAAQYQQRPAPLGGGIVKWEWFRTHATPPRRQSGDLVVQSWDTATKADQANDYSVCTTWLVRDQQAWLIDLFRAKLEFPELRRRIEIEARRHDVSEVLIEEAGSGVALVQDLKRGARLRVIGMTPRDDKATRLLAVTPQIEAGRVSVPSDAPWLAEFRREMVLFPNGKHDDQVDSTTQFLKWMDRPRHWSGTIRFRL
jgi:predicted phage terminase large subunit-like protein